MHGKLEFRERDFILHPLLPGAGGLNIKKESQSRDLEQRVRVMCDKELP